MTKLARNISVVAAALTASMTLTTPTRAALNVGDQEIRSELFELAPSTFTPKAATDPDQVEDNELAVSLPKASPDSLRAEKPATVTITKAAEATVQMSRRYEQKAKAQDKGKQEPIDLMLLPLLGCGLAASWVGNMPYRTFYRHQRQAKMQKIL